MNAKRAIGILFAGLLLATGVAAAAETVVKKFPLPDHGVFQMQVPAAWSDRVQQPPNSLPPTITFQPKQGKPFQVLVTPLWRLKPDVQMPNKDELRQRVERSINAVRDAAVEKDIKTVELVGAAGPGYYFSVTDKAPKPDEFKYMSQGMLRVGELLATFTILTNDGQNQIAQDALAMLKSAVNLPK
jgi:hypothetical protein